VNDAEYEESDDEEDVVRQRSGAASQKRARLDAEESAPKTGASTQATAAPLPSSAIPSPLPATVPAPGSPLLSHPSVPAAPTDTQATNPVSQSKGDGGA